MKRKRDVLQLFMIAGIHRQLQALTNEVEEDFQRVFTIDHEDPLTSGDSDESDFLEVLGHGLCAMSLALSNTSRGGPGAYYRIPKSKDFFAVSLRWPDCWF